MKAWVGIVLLMGYIRLPNYYAYWSTNPLTRQPGIQQIMTRDRFLSILQFLHLCNNSQALPADREDHDRIHKIRTFMEQVLIPLWQGAYYPEQDVSVDETLVAFKGRTALMQYKPKKPHKWGLNVWTLADQDGYVFNWDLYAGKKRGGAVEHGLTYDVVTKLCRPIYNNGHHVYMDNYFSSPELFNELANNQTGACGTLRLNRRGIPDRVKTAKPAKGDHWEIHLSLNGMEIYCIFLGQIRDKSTYYLPCTMDLYFGNKFGANGDRVQIPMMYIVLCISQKQ